MLKRLWRWLNSKGPTPSHGGVPQLYSIDVDALADQLDIASHAKTEGLLNQPHLDAVTLTGTESLVLQFVEKARHDYVHWATLRQASLDSSVSELNITSDIAYAKQLAKEYDSKANSRIADQQSLL